MTISSLNIGDVLGYKISDGRIFRYEVVEPGVLNLYGDLLHVGIKPLDEDQTDLISSYPFPLDEDQQKHWCIVSRREVQEEYV